LYRKQQHNYSNGRRYLRLVYRRYYGCHHGKPNGHYDLYGYGNERERLYRQRFCHCNG
jgi:hypothetical protein